MMVADAPSWSETGRYTKNWKTCSKITCARQGAQTGALPGLQIFSSEECFAPFLDFCNFRKCYFCTLKLWFWLEISKNRKLNDRFPNPRTIIHHEWKFRFCFRNFQNCSSIKCANSTWNDINRQWNQEFHAPKWSLTSPASVKLAPSMHVIKWYSEFSSECPKTRYSWHPPRSLSYTSDAFYE